MSWDDCDLFCRVVEYGGFSAAARALERPKSSLSAAVMRLEATLEARLLERTTRRLHMTEAGEALYHDMQPLFAELRHSYLESLALRRGISGTLRIGSPYEFAAHHLAAVACTMMASYRQLRVQLDVQHESVDPLSQGYDIAFAMLEAPLPASTIVVRRVFSLERRLFASPEFLALAREPEHPRQLAQLPLIVSTHDTEWRFKCPDGSVERVGLQSSRLSSSNADVRLQAAIAGLGVMRVTGTFGQAAVQSGRLRQLLGSYVCDPLRVYALLPAKRLMPEKVRLFLELLNEQAAALGAA
ncbi:MAG: LysR family transcriptional regulator [Burkholderiales bacterium]